MVSNQFSSVSVRGRSSTSAVPRTVALLGGQILVFPRGALTRVDAIEHRQQEGAPRRFPGFVRQAQLVEPLMQGQRAVQLAEVCP